MAETVEVPIRKFGAGCTIDARRMARSRRNDGRTIRAAARLASFRLTRLVRENAVSEVDDRSIQYDQDFMRDEATLYASVRVAALPDWVPTPFRLPPELTRVKFDKPRPNPVAH